MAESKRDKVARQIRAIMAQAKGEGVTEAEAATFAARAAQLCLDYNIDQMTIKDAEKQEIKIVTGKIGKAWSVHPKHILYVRNALEKLLDVYIYWEKELSPGGGVVTQYWAIGLEMNVMTASMTFDYWEQAIEYLVGGAKAAGRIYGGAQANSFRKGAGKRLKDRVFADKVKLIEETGPTGMEMVRYTDQLIKVETDRLGLKPKKVKIKSSNKTAHAEGYIQGGLIDLRTRNPRMIE